MISAFFFKLLEVIRNRSIIEDNAFVHFQEPSVYTFPHICMTLKGRELFPKMITLTFSNPYLSQFGIYLKFE